MPTLIKFKSRNRSVGPFFVPAPVILNDSLRRPLPDARWNGLHCVPLRNAIPAQQIDGTAVERSSMGEPMRTSHSLIMKIRHEIPTHSFVRPRRSHSSVPTTDQ